MPRPAQLVVACAKVHTEQHVYAVPNTLLQQQVVRLTFIAVRIDRRNVTRDLLGCMLCNTHGIMIYTLSMSCLTATLSILELAVQTLHMLLIFLCLLFKTHVQFSVFALKERIACFSLIKYSG